ncbi:putative RTX-family protein [Candidatus Regiella insecticola LSR1]|uniref:Putative RTX-family protein n=1 Tax=Candidatus Regiella insecticola LSR1 TaxID=663321 RepID=E0WQX2_9ENTR|nr:putative RTX-family protein [Candidatus Regiella insecticola LSR1]
MVLSGDEGNNTLGLGRGYAAGGKGTDTYNILRNQSAVAAKIVLKEHAVPQEYSKVLLDYDAIDIASVQLSGEDVYLELRGDNGARTELRLENMYRLHADGQKKSLQHSYVLYTRDGLRITGWPQTVNRAVDGQWPSLTPLVAHYLPDSDQSRRAFLSTARPEDIQVKFITPSRDGEKQVKVTIKGKPVSRHENNNPTLVPHFLQLAQVGTKFSTQMQGDKRNNTLSTTLLPGDEENNRLWHRHSKDSLKGKGGADRYQVHAGAREVEIDNQDDGSENDGEIAQDILMLPWDFEDMRIAQQGLDVVLTHASDPHSHPTVRIKRFMQHKNNRHLWLQDKNGVIDELQVTAKHQLLFYGLGEEAKPVHQEAARASSLLLEAMSGFTSSRHSSPDPAIPALLVRIDPSAASLGGIPAKSIRIQMQN